MSAGAPMSARPRKRRGLLSPAHHPVDHGSQFDPILCGVASGLDDLFPPIPHPSGMQAARREPAGTLSAVSDHGTSAPTITGIEHRPSGGTPR